MKPAPAGFFISPEVMPAQAGFFIVTTEVNIEAVAGDTVTHVVRWADGDSIVKKAISGVSLAGVCVVTAVGHGMPNGWPFTIQSVRGTVEINNEILETNSNGAPIVFGKGANGKLSYEASNVAADSVSLADVNSLDFGAYQSGGVLIYLAPKSLAGATARMQVKVNESDTDALVTLTEASGIAIDNTNKTITFTLSPAHTGTDIGDGDFYFDLEITIGTIVTTIIKGKLTLIPQVTTP